MTGVFDAGENSPADDRGTRRGDRSRWLRRLVRAAVLVFGLWVIAAIVTSLLAALELRAGRKAALRAQGRTLTELVKSDDGRRDLAAAASNFDAGRRHL